MYESSIVLNMAALSSITFEESLSKALSGLNLENVSLCVEQKEAISTVISSFEQGHTHHFANQPHHICHFYFRFKILLFAS